MTSFSQRRPRAVLVPSASASAPRIMLAICDKYANDYCISFNASNSQCLVVLPPKCRFLGDYIKDCTFYVGSNPIEYVDSFEHLGHVITNQLTDNVDILKRRSDFVWKSNNVLCFFSKLSSLIKYRLFHSYYVSLYGSELWLYIVTTRSTTSVFHGGKACAEYGVHRSILIVIYSRCWVSVYLY